MSRLDLLPPPREKLRKGDGRNQKYMILRAIERMDPLSVWGRPWDQLTRSQQVRLLAYSDLRLQEETEKPE